MKDSKGKPVQERGKYLTVWRKQADGNWRVVIDTFNSDAPPPKAEKK
jgi:ketosteroid isomerase-like protein